MGCDIHLHIEIKVEGEWLHYSATSIGRNYRLFGKLAGVRDDSIDPIAPLRGLPGDATKVTKLDYFGHHLLEANDGFPMDTRDNWHSASWIGRNEIKTLADWLMTAEAFYKKLDLEHEILNCYLFNNAFWGGAMFKGERERGFIEDVRFVFWFDN